MSAKPDRSQQMSQPSRVAQRDITRTPPASTESTTDRAVGNTHEVERALDDWRKDIHAPQVGVQGERKPEFSTQALHWPVAPLYTPLDLETCGFDYLRDVG